MHIYLCNIHNPQFVIIQLTFFGPLSSNETNFTLFTHTHQRTRNAITQIKAIGLIKDLAMMEGFINDWRIYIYFRWSPEKSIWSNCHAPTLLCRSLPTTCSPGLSKFIHKFLSTIFRLKNFTEKVIIANRRQESL